MVKELGIGLALGILIIFALQGINVLPVLFILFLAFFMWQLLTQGNIGGSAGISASKTDSNKKIPSVRFKEIGGQESAKKELIESLEFVKNIQGVKHMGIRAIKGILLSGPPGTGKTMLVKAAACYTKSFFVSASGSEFIEMYAGLGAKRVRNLFKEARQNARKSGNNSVIIFIDEIDVLGSKRGQVSSHMEYDQTLNQLLVEMDGLSIEDDIQILVMAASNRADVLDPALLRPGRFDRIVNVELPDKDGRLKILKIHTANKPLADDVNLDQIARETFRFSGAHLENLANEAAIFALRENSTIISTEHFMEAIDKIIMGEKLDRKPNKDELKRIAVHETGHAIIGEIMNPGAVAAITITSRGKALGYVRHNPEDDIYLMTKDYLKKQINIAIAGSISEEILLTNKSTGAKNDFEKAIKYAKTMLLSGMTDLGVVDENSIPKEILHQETSKILTNSDKLVREILENQKELINQISEELIVSERFSGERLRELMKENNVA